jgi:hypothetical protein
MTGPILIEENGPKQPEYKLFVLFLAILGNTQMDPKKIYKDPQVGRIYGSLSELKISP